MPVFVRKTAGTGYCVFATAPSIANELFHVTQGGEVKGPDTWLMGKGICCKGDYLSGITGTHMREQNSSSSGCPLTSLPTGKHGGMTFAVISDEMKNFK